MPPAAPPRIETERLVLRLGEAGDADAIARYFTENRAHLAPSRPIVGEEFYTAPFWRAQADAHLAELREGRSVRLFVFPRSEPARVIGNVNFTQIFRHPAHYCVMGYGLDREHVGRGMMSEAVGAAVEYMFREQRIHRVMANYVPRNERSGSLLRRLGFTVEGYARDYLLLNGRWEDHILTSRIAPEWRAP
jgi:ribosomal-protein-alanine N-acetyltransferase